MPIEIDFVKVTRTESGTQSRTLTLEFKGFGDTQQPDNAETVPGVEFAQPLGLTARPAITDDTEAVIIRRGDEAIAVVVLDKSGSALNVEEGGTQLYGGTDRSAIVYIRANGDVEITPKAGQNVIIAGGSTPVAKEGSGTVGHTHTITGTAGPYAISAVNTTNTDSIASGAGSAHVKVP